MIGCEVDADVGVEGRLSAARGRDPARCFAACDDALDQPALGSGVAAFVEEGQLECAVLGGSRIAGVGFHADPFQFVALFLE